MGVKTAVVVDPFSTGALLAPYLRARDYQRLLSVRSSPDLAASLVSSGKPEQYDEHIDFDGDLAKLTARLRADGVRLVAPGNESAVALTDQLADALGVRGNPLASSLARRNKHVMIDRLRAAGLHCARQTVAAQWEDAAAWLQDHNQWPVVVKPLDSASTDHVFVCPDAAAAERAFQSVMASKNFCGHRNEAALIQSYLDGLEYVVNTVSRDGRHYVCDILESRKQDLNGSPLMYDFYRLLPPTGPIQQALRSYIVKALDALEVRNGGGHAELRMTAEGPALIEVGARGMGPLYSTTTIARGTGHDMAELIIDVLDDGHLFDALVDRDYAMNQHAMVVYLSSQVEGVTTALPIADKLAAGAAPSLVDWQLTTGVGRPVARTVDLVTVLGKVHLAHPDGAQVDRDYAMLREWERSAGPVVVDAL